MHHLACYLEGGQLFGINNNDIDSGGGHCGLYCWRNPGARFIVWQISQSIWKTHYTFVKEGQLPAGARIRVYSGSRGTIDVSGSTLDSSDRQLIRRFVASHAEEESGARFSSGSEIRISYSSDIKQYSHTRRFISGDRFNVIGNTKN